MEAHRANKKSDRAMGRRRYSSKSGEGVEGVKYLFDVYMEGDRFVFGVQWTNSTRSYEWLENLTGCEAALAIMGQWISGGCSANPWWLIGASPVVYNKVAPTNVQYEFNYQEESSVSCISHAIRNAAAALSVPMDKSLVPDTLQTRGECLTFLQSPSCTITLTSNGKHTMAKNMDCFQRLPSGTVYLCMVKPRGGMCHHAIVVDSRLTKVVLIDSRCTDGPVRYTRGSVKWIQSWSAVYPIVVKPVSRKRKPICE